MTIVTQVVDRSRASAGRLVAHEFRADLRSYVRNRETVFWTVAMPILFILIFGSVFQHQSVIVSGGQIDEAIYYVPEIIAFGLIASTFSNVVVSVVRYREGGIYKRRRATPVSAQVIIAGRALVAALSALAITGVLLAIGWLAFGAQVPARTGAAFLVDVVVGAIVFCCLGFAVASLVRNVESAQPIALATILSLAMISGIFIPIGELPTWIVNVSRVFPVRALSDALLSAFNPHTAGGGFNLVDLAILGAWGAAAVLVAVRRFHWMPRGR